MRLIAIPLFTSLLAAAPATTATPTFYKDVLPILQNRCQECHRSGEAAPMALGTYNEVRPWAKAIQQAVLKKQMPPWYADPHFGKFANDRSMPENEIKILSDWAVGGAPQGNAKDAPKPVTFASGWTIGKPDVVFDIGMDYKIPASGTIDYTYFLVPTNFTEDKWVKDLEVRPGDRAVVHHLVLYARPKTSKFLSFAKPGMPFVAPEDKGPDASKRPPQNDRASFYGINNNGYEMVGVYVPGGLAYKTLDGQARLIPAGADLVFQVHYTTNGKATTDRSKVGIVFAKETPKERVVNTFLVNPSLRIPPGASDHKVFGKLTLAQDTKIQSFFPHMHVRGKAYEYVATYPTGERQTLLKVPAYDFNWQLTYELEKPVILPKGTILEGIATYDNSPNNKSNPDPTKEVFWGEQTWEEMFAGFLDIAIPADMNPTEIVRPKKPATGALD